ncbi:hypothetical protein HanRHA438_Chr00c12g0849191 [Helianthus annuus]|nr:hypothetical protein HanRHA438_Chr00c12g0849191 [Helianthus annuus]
MFGSFFLEKRKTNYEGYICNFLTQPIYYKESLTSLWCRFKLKKNHYGAGDFVFITFHSIE